MAVILKKNFEFWDVFFSPHYTVPTCTCTGVHALCAIHVYAWVVLTVKHGIIDLSKP